MIPQFTIMKRIGKLWDKIVDKDNLRLALRKAAKGKRGIGAVRKVERNTEKYIDKLHNMLVSGNYKTAAYKSQIVHEPKRRTIHSLPFFPDRIVHHAILNVLGDYWDKLFIHDSYACRQKKGQHAGSSRCMSMVRRNTYVLKCDISKFYHSIHHGRLKAILRRKIKDPRVLDLLYEIIDSSSSCPELSPGRGVPIGNLMSQWFGNIYLNELDTFIKHTLKIKDYIRYCDDFVLFSNDKHKLCEAAIELRNFLTNVLDLCFSKCEYFPTSHGVDFLGYRHFKTHILVRKSTAKRIRRRVTYIKSSIAKGHVNFIRFIGQVDSALGWLKWANSYNLKLSIDIRHVRELLHEYK